MAGIPSRARVGRRVAIGAGAASLAAAAGVAEAQFILNSDAVKGTWVLQQTDSVAQFDSLMAGYLGSALNEANIVGFSQRVPWNVIDGDFTLLQRGYDAATSRGLKYAPRFMAGRHTPARIFNAPINCPYYLKDGTNEKVPRPFKTDGTPNTVFEAQWDAFVEQLENWCRARNIRELHLSWYGQDWAELNHGAQVRALPGYTYQNWLNGHKRLIDRALAHADAYLAVEFPFSGHGPLSSNTGSPAARDFADHVIASIGTCKPRFFAQANGWGPSSGGVMGDWGAPDAATEAAFDSDVWPEQIYRGQQMIQPYDYANWSTIFQQLYTNKATYCEVYAGSFYTTSNAPQPHLAQLRTQILNFKNHISAATPKPTGC